MADNDTEFDGATQPRTTPTATQRVVEDIADAAQATQEAMTEAVTETVHATQSRWARMTSDADARKVLQDRVANTLFGAAVVVAAPTIVLPAAAAYGTYKGVKAVQGRGTKKDTDNIES